MKSEPGKVEAPFDISVTAFNCVLPTYVGGCSVLHPGLSPADPPAERILFYESAAPRIGLDLRSLAR